MPKKPRRLPMTAENILSILAGRKTQTRRVMREQPGTDNRIPFPGKPRVAINICDPRLRDLSPYGVKGDPLAITETWRPIKVRQGCALIEYGVDKTMEYRAIPDDDAREKINRALAHGRWMPPMFMQTWASRIPAVNDGVTVERVQDITEEDILAEGVKPCADLMQAWIDLWDSINGCKKGRSWKANPAVWAVTFKRTGV